MNHHSHRRRLVSVLSLLLVAANVSFAQEKSVNPGINDSYKDPNPTEFTKRFETESREIFAQGAIRAAIWAFDKKPGLYDMADVLGIN